MYKIELFANYSLRDLLPVEMKIMIEGNAEGSKNNTILISFKEEKDYLQFMTLCTTYGFKTKIQRN